MTERHNIITCPTSWYSNPKVVMGRFSTQLNKLVLTHSNLTVCLSAVSYPDTVDCYSIYHALLNALLCLIQVSLSNSPFSLKSACLNMFLSWILSYEDLHKIALPGLIISILFLCIVSYSVLAHFILSIYTVQSLTQYFTCKLHTFTFLYVLSTQYSVLRQ